MDSTTRKIFRFLEEKGFQPRTDFWIDKDGLIGFSERVIEYIIYLLHRNLDQEELFDFYQDLALSLKEEI